MVCRSTSTTPSASCWNGNNGGQQLGYDALRRLISWQNAPGSSPTASEQYAYDGEGQRVWQQATSVNGSTTTTTTTAYVLGIDEVSTTSVTGQQATTANVRSYPLPGGALAAHGDIAQAIVAAAETTEAGEKGGSHPNPSYDLIAMATHGRGKSFLARLALGSVTDRVLHQSKLPLLVVRPREAATPTRD